MSDRVDQAIADAFPVADAGTVRAILEQCDRDGSASGRERVQLAVLNLCDGDMDQVSALVQEANRDFRDVLYWEYLAEGYADPVTDRLYAALLPAELIPRRLALLRQAVPGLSHVGVLWNPANAFHQPQLEALEQQARALGLKLAPAAVCRPADFEPAFAAMRGESADGLVILTSSLHRLRPRRLAALSLDSRLASIGELSQFARVGGLLSFGPRQADLGRRVVGHIRQALRADPPSPPAAEGPTLELVLNLRTAHALGLAIPRSILKQATELIR